jgi:dipeptidyl aminopeptidase/acylaminoacyl peptidase
VSPPNLYVYDYDWAPDGHAFAAEAAVGSGTNNYWIAQLYVVRADTGAATSIWKPPLQIACPRWSPDGNSIAVVHGIMSDEGATGGDVYVVPAAGGAARNVTPKLEGSARAVAWASDGRIVVDEYVDGSSAIVTTDAHAAAPKTLWSAPQQMTALSISADASAAAAAVQSFAKAPEVFAGPIGAWQPQTSTNSAVAPMWGEARSLHWTSDRYRVQGWLLYPADFNPSQRYPLVVSVHGGPSSANFPSWPQRWNAVLPTQGYFVLLPNPRGSYGSGEAFTQANVMDFGYGDLRDILGGVDAAVKAAPIDPDRVGITGWSYGGYMTMWAVTQTTRFKAAVAGAGIANWQSYYGENRIDQWMLPFFGASVYDKPEVYERSSPITFIKKVKTPTLVLHGDRDSEVPTPQGYEFWHALKALGVPTELVIYTDEGHAISKPDDVRDIEERLVAWFDRFLR